MESEGKETLESYVRESRGRAYQAALGLCRNPVEAEDLMQETLHRVLKKWELYDETRPLGAWLLAVMKNAFLDGKRSIRRRREVSLEKFNAGENVFPRLYLSDGEPDILDSLIREETAATVREAFSDLSDKHREILILADVEGLEYHEIAVWKGIPMGTVRSRIARGRAHLRRKVRELDAELVP